MWQCLKHKQVYTKALERAAHLGYSTVKECIEDRLLIKNETITGLSDKLDISPRTVDKWILVLGLNFKRRRGEQNWRNTKWQKSALEQ